MHWKKLLALTLLTLLAGFAVFCFWHATASGLVISPDSRHYIGAARSLLAGQGLTVNGSPMTHFPPLLSVLLATGGWVSGLDPVVVARWLNAILLAANVFLMGYAIHRSTGAVLMAFLGGTLVLAATDIVEVHTWAWSEPAMLCFGLAGLVMLSGYFGERRLWRLSAAAGCLGAALLTRYAAMPLIVTALLGILLFRPGRFLGRMKDAGVFALISCGPFVLWLVRNWWVAGTLTHRSFSQHPVYGLKYVKAQATVAQWFDGGTGMVTYDRQTPILRVAASISVVLVAVLIWKTIRPSRNAAGLSQVLRLPWLLLIFGVSYFSFLIVSITFFDANTPLNARILSPLHFAAIGFSLMVLHAGCAPYRWTRWTVAAASLVLGSWLIWAHVCHCGERQFGPDLRPRHVRKRLFVPSKPIKPTLEPPGIAAH